MASVMALAACGGSGGSSGGGNTSTITSVTASCITLNRYVGADQPVLGYGFGNGKFQFGGHVER